MATEKIFDYFIFKGPLVSTYSQVVINGDAQYFDLIFSTHFHTGKRCAGSYHNTDCSGLGTETSCVPAKIAAVIQPGKPPIVKMVSGFVCSHYKRVKR